MPYLNFEPARRNRRSVRLKQWVIFSFYGLVLGAGYLVLGIRHPIMAET